MYEITGIMPKSDIVYQTERSCWKFTFSGLFKKTPCIIKVDLFREDKMVISVYAEKKMLRHGNIKEVLKKSEHFHLVKEKIEALEEKMKKAILIKGEKFLGQGDNYTYSRKKHIFSFSAKESSFTYLSYKVERDLSFTVVEKENKTLFKDIDICIFSAVKKEKGEGVALVYDETYNIEEKPSSCKNIKLDDVLLMDSTWRPEFYCSFSPYRYFEEDLVELVLSAPSLRLKMLTKKW